MREGAFCWSWWALCWSLQILGLVAPTRGPSRAAQGIVRGGSTRQTFRTACSLPCAQSGNPIGG